MAEVAAHSEVEEICFYIRYDYKGQRRTKPLYMSLEALVVLSCEEFKFNIVQSVPYLEACQSSWRLSLDVDTKKFLSLIKNVASKSDKVIINIEVSFTPSPKRFSRYQEDHPKGRWYASGWRQNEETLLYDWFFQWKWLWQSKEPVYQIEFLWYKHAICSGFQFLIASIIEKSRRAEGCCRRTFKTSSVSARKFRAGILI